ncbi:MAG: YfcE family phosphodiesterase [Tepidisphaeraceae bacterium]
MILGILSDTHGRTEAARAGIEILRAGGAERLVHCGDVGSEPIIDLLAGANAAFVWGNTDDDRDELARYAQRLGVQCLGRFGELDLDGKLIAVTHGDNPQLVREILHEQKHDYLLTGHTHVCADQRTGRVRAINPGALHRAAVKTVALLDLRTDALRFLPVVAR